MTEPLRDTITGGTWIGGAKPGTLPQLATIERPADGEYSYDSVDITVDGVPTYYAIPGQTGSCWNIGQYLNGDRDDATLHVCDLDDMVDLLRALRASDANVEQVRRWEGNEAAARLREERGAS